MDPNELRRLGHQLADWIAGYRERLETLPVNTRRWTALDGARAGTPNCGDVRGQLLARARRETSAKSGCLSPQP